MSVEAAVAKLTGREYVVLGYTPEMNDHVGNDLWEVLGRAGASSADAAIRQVVPAPTDGCSYVAVPGRSWKPMEPETTTETRTRWRTVAEVRAEAGEPEEGES